MSFWNWTTTTLVMLATFGVLLVCCAEEPPARNEKAAKKPPWAKNIAQWKAERTSDPADNSYCDVCHLNYRPEKLAKTHHKAGVGCETCHGISDKHSEDEDGITPPEVMFAESQIVAFCMSCHDKKDLLEEDAHEDLFSEKADPKNHCTTCHGKKHRLKVRTRRWDKKTGKLIWSDGVRMMEEKPKAGLSGKDDGGGLP